MHCESVLLYRQIAAFAKATQFEFAVRITLYITNIFAEASKRRDQGSRNQTPGCILNLTLDCEAIAQSY